ncbi:DUF5906 domain-containing protein [Methylobacterium soli]|nr:DUF5906 domain-containing protein [Methylobacterium soli]GJE41868.1 hypothetical protein AEGHOMDF_1038 [Methylobacterium soli]
MNAHVPVNHQTAMDQLLSAMAAQGIEPGEPLKADGKLERFHVQGDRKGSLNGWACIHMDAQPAGQFGCKKRHGEHKFSWRAAGITKPMTPAERKAQQAEWDRKKAEKAEAERKRHADAAVRANDIWAEATPASDDHPYLKRKGVKAHGLRVGKWEFTNEETGDVFMLTDNALLVPIADKKRQVQSLQALFPGKILGKGEGARDKDFLKHGAKLGLFHAIGRPQPVDGRPVYVIVEGYATGASIHEATGHLVLVAFDTSNLLPVAEAIREAKPEAIIVLAADNDQWTTKPVANPGVHFATRAAAAVGGLLAIPPFAADAEGQPTDFNDLVEHAGRKAVTSVFDAVLAAGEVLRSELECVVEPDDGVVDDAPPFEGEQAIEPVGTVTELLTYDEIIEAIVAAPNEKAIRDLAETIKAQPLEVTELARVMDAYRNAFLMLTGTSLTKAEAKKALTTKHKAKRQAVSDLPEWLDGWVYLTKWECFYHVETGRAMSRAAFDAAHTRFVPPTEEGTQPAASNEALNFYMIETAERTMYLPSAGARFEFERLPIINSFSDTMLPPADDEISEAGAKAIEIIQNHLKMILGGREEQIQLFTDWLAFQVQHIGEKVRYAPLIKGIEGDGKTLIKDILAAAIGGRNIRTAGPAELASQFNGYAEGAAVVMLEEIRMVGHNRHDVLNAVKPLITNDTAPIVRKGRDGYEIINVTNYIAVTNFADAIPINDNDRRWWVIFTPWSAKAEMAVRIGRPLADYFCELHDAIRNNAPAIRRWLLNWKISDQFNPNGHAPHTEERDIMIGASKSEEDDALRELVERGGIGFNSDVVFVPKLLEAYNALLPSHEAIKGQSLSNPLRKLGLVKWKRMRWNGESQNVWLRSPVGATELSVRAMLDKTRLGEALIEDDDTPF